MNISRHEVCLWSGVVPNELLGFSATMDPDTLPISYDANGKANITIPANGTLAVNANTLGGAYTLDGSVTLGAGAKIVFDNANFPGGMTFTAEGGFNVPSGSITDYVTLTAPNGYAVNLQGNTVDFCTANDRGLKLGGAGARSFMTISGGKLFTNWIDAGHKDVTECMIVQTGGEVETGINNNGNIWLGRNARGRATYTLSGGALTADALTLSAQKGPDASTADIAEIVAEQKTGDQMPYRFVRMYEDGVFDLGGNTLVQPGFFGVGTVRNGNVEVAQMIAPAEIREIRMRCHSSPFTMADRMPRCFAPCLSAAFPLRFHRTMGG